MTVSIFNDVIGPVMRGPSSSHCAAALRIGLLARDLMGDDFDHVLIQYDNSGSLPATHASQGSDMGLFGGLLGWQAHDEALPNSMQHFADAGKTHAFEYGDFGDEHPNTYRLTLSRPDQTRSIIAISTGGGMIEVTHIDDVSIDMDGGFDETLIEFDDPECDVNPFKDELETSAEVEQILVCKSGRRTLMQVRSSGPLSRDRIKSLHESADIVSVCELKAVLPIRSRADMRVPFQTCNDLLALPDVDNFPLWHWAIEYEMQRGNVSQQQVIDRMIEIVRIARDSIHSGLKGTQYDDRVLGFQSGGFQQMMDAGKLLDAGVLNRIVLYTTAMMEVKSSMGVIIAAPTAGACAALPATCVAMGEAMELDDVEIAKALLASGLIGVFIATAWSFAAEVGGCQAEGGSAAAMSAAALVTMSGGKTSQATGAASMALQNMLGLICDPVANRVEVPCLGKNVIAASNAISCANMSLAGFDCVIPLDETIQAAKRVSERMPREHRCTALGGLAMTPTSLKIEQRLKQCGSGCGC